MLESVEATTQNLAQLEVVLVVDQDDQESISFEYSGVPLKRVVVQPGLTMGALNMAGYKAAAGEYLMLLNDDVVLRTPGWDEQVLAAFRSFPDGIVLTHVNDLLFRDTLATFPFVTREFCSLTGGICPEGYVRYRIDDHIHNIFDLLSVLGRHRRIFLPEVVFEHTNIAAPGEGSERYVPDPAIHEIDTRLFDALLPERKRIALEAMGRIESRLSAEREPSWQKKLRLVTDSVAIRHREHARWFPIAKSSPDKRPRVTIGIVSGDLKSSHARKCVELVKTCTTNYDLVLMDNNGDPNFNHSREMNRILSVCRTDYLVLMDDDVFVQPGWLEGLLRGLGPDVGVVTPLHKDRQCRLSYAGIVMRPDEAGHHTHILEAPNEPQRIQTLCSAIMLIDMPKCGQIRLDERYSKYFLDIDYGLRVWEEGFQVVCSPYSEVTHLAGATLEQGGPRSAQLFEEQRQRYWQSWVDSGRIQRLRQGVWRTIPEIQWIDEKTKEIDRLFDEGDRRNRDEFMRDAVSVAHTLAAYPALMDYIAARARLGLGETPARVDDPKAGHLAFLLGLSGQGVLFEEGFEGMNIVLENFAYYALPQGEGVFSGERMVRNGYSRSFEAESVEALKSLIWRCRKGQVRGHVVERTSRPASDRKESPPPRPPDASSESPGLAGMLASRNKVIAQLSAIVANRPKSSGWPRPAPASDVGARRSNPLVHFLETGAYEGRRPNPSFDPIYYLSENPDVAAAGINPLAHYLEVGAQEGRRPSPVFDSAYYVQQNSEVAAAGIHPLAHLTEKPTVRDVQPGPLPDSGPVEQPSRASTASRSRSAPLARLSVVIPTHNRGALLSGTVEACLRNAGGCELEMIVVDDGSTDDTPQRLSELSARIPNLSWHSVRKMGPGRARNIGADAARHEVIVFLGDDIRPDNEDFFRVHSSLHSRHPDENLAVLGKVVWAHGGSEPITYTMAHIQGRGGEQFGYFQLTPYTFVTWPYFYTANVSVKKSLVPDWVLDGFDADFPGPAYEDLEFAYRLSKTPKGLKIFYDPAATASHHHHYTLAQFMDRQAAVGKSLVHFLALHPELAGACHLQDFIEALSTPKGSGHDELLAECRLLVDGVKAWARIIDGDSQIGYQPWHDDFLSAVLEICLLDGFVSEWPARGGDLAAASTLILDRFCQRMRQSLQHEVADWSFLTRGFVSQTGIHPFTGRVPP